MITTLYASLLAIFYVALAAYVIQGRYKYKIGLGDGGNPYLLRRIRMQGNFAEYVPLALILLFLVDDARFPVLLVHALGLMLLIGRVLHAAGVHHSSSASTGRVAGMILTLTMMLVCAVLLLWRYMVLTLTAL